MQGRFDCPTPLPRRLLIAIAFLMLAVATRPSLAQDEPPNDEAPNQDAQPRIAAVIEFSGDRRLTPPEELPHGAGVGGECVAQHALVQLQPTVGADRESDVPGAPSDAPRGERIARIGAEAIRVGHRSGELHLDPAQDALMAEMALEAAERSRQRLAGFFGMGSGGRERPVRIEIYPTAERFHQAAGLSRRDSEVTGAVGITAFNKVMLISPRARLLGYRWLDSGRR